MVYLNNAATAYPRPSEVISSVSFFLNSPPFNPSRTGFDNPCNDIINSCRKKLALLFNIPGAERIVFTSGGTESLNLAIKGLPLSDKHVITTATEHNSVLRPLKQLEREGRISLSIISCDKYGYIDPEDIKKEINKNTALIVVNHCSNVTGAIQDIEAIGEISGNNGLIFLVDGSQSAGTTPVSLEKIDLFAFTGHKALYGLPGTGGLYIREGLYLNPLKTGGTGIKSELLHQPEEMPLYYEGGTPNLPGIVALSSGLDFILKIGIEKIKEWKEKLFLKIINEMERIPEIVIYNKKDIPSQILSFNIKGMEPGDAGYILEQSFGIITRTGLHCAPLIHKFLGSHPRGSVRISPSYFTTLEEIDCFLEAMKNMVKL